MKLFSLIFVIFAFAFSSTTYAEDVNHLELASLLTRDGRFQRAQNELNQVKPGNLDDSFKVLNIQGLIYMGQGAYEKARTSFLDSRAFFAKNKKWSPEDRLEKRKQVLLYLAQSTYKLERFNEVIQYLNEAKYQSFDRISVFLLMSSAHWRLKKYGQAVHVLDQGQAKFPESAEFPRQKALYYTDLGLYQSAYDIALKISIHPNLYKRDLLSLGAAFRSKGEFALSEKVLNFASLRFNKSADIYLELAHTYLKQNRTWLAAQNFEKAAAFESKYYAEATEVYRAAGRSLKARWLSQFIPDTKKRLKQVLALNLGEEKFEAVKASANELSRKNLLADQEVNYALAYSYFRLGEFKVVEKYLSHISKPDLLKKAVALREGISTCKEKGVWTCL